MAGTYYGISDGDGHQLTIGLDPHVATTRALRALQRHPESRVRDAEVARLASARSRVAWVIWGAPRLATRRAWR